MSVSVPAAASTIAAGGAEAVEAFVGAVALTEDNAEALVAGLGDLAASSIASPPLGQKVQARHLHHLQWNFMNFSLQKA